MASLNPREKRTTWRRRFSIFSPRRRRWERFLKSFTLDPADLERPLQEPGERDVIICGVPRSGTTLLAAALFQPPQVVSVMEPWDGMRLAPAELFRSLRKEIEATSALSRGKLDVHALHSERTVRWTKEGSQVVPLPKLSVDYVLAIKWPAFWQYLPLLPNTRFLVCVRNPLEVIESFKNQSGRLSEGLNYDIAFNQEMNRTLLAATNDPAERRILLYEYISERILPFSEAPNVLVVHYERWAKDLDGLLEDISNFLECDLTSVPVQIHQPASVNPLTAEGPNYVGRIAPLARKFGYELDNASQQV